MEKIGNSGKKWYRWENMVNMVKQWKMRCDAIECDTFPKCGENGKKWKLYIIILIATIVYNYETIVYVVNDLSVV